MHECRYTADRNFDIDANGVRTLQLALGRNDAHVDGVDGLKRIEVRGKACASNEDWLKDLTLQQSRDGDRVRIEADQDHPLLFNWTDSRYAYIDVQVRVPKALLLEIEAGSGDSKVADVAGLGYKAGSGDLIANHIAGALSIHVGSGDVIADDVGAVTVERGGSGDIRVTKAGGEVKVGHVGSGDLSFDDVRGGVHVESVGSGDLRISHTSGDVEIGSIGSGDVTVARIGGSFIVHHAGSGDLHHRDVAGKVDVPARHADD
jgi:DUF4097 and DUF4098 domain-containing protein YvlB